ncbi:MAG: EamA/RhaT family transporter, partial [Pseudomonadota bacterium]
MIWAFTALGFLGAAGTAVLVLVPELAGASGTGFVFRPWEPVTLEILVWTAAVGLGALGGVAFLTRSYQLAEASYVAVFEYSLLIFGAFWGYLLFGQVVATHGVVGIGLILVSGILIGWS